MKLATNLWTDPSTFYLFGNPMPVFISKHVTL